MSESEAPRPEWSRVALHGEFLALANSLRECFDHLGDDECELISDCAVDAHIAGYLVASGRWSTVEGAAQLVKAHDALRDIQAASSQLKAALKTLERLDVERPSMGPVRAALPETLAGLGSQVHEYAAALRAGEISERISAFGTTLCTYATTLDTPPSSDQISALLVDVVAGLAVFTPCLSTENRLKPAHFPDSASSGRWRLEYDLCLLLDSLMILTLGESWSRDE
ncbi:MAG: hypothetical protein B5766_12885 [Candidatus Lumbricidophila eiseniae]|uniref:Uncharacterized protein n=1 Tax=Candidatus Lumbricidiphila eiseniae TaxID=1969409 RepID=A0A2A6FML0_9MICO|nr:MAG: hypothetical protein B5766_12885 [Candidatus Lumbricidophila eiseniae]